MRNVLIKGIPKRAMRKLKKLAKEKKISRNQLMIQIIEEMVIKEEEQEKRKEQLSRLKSENSQGREL